MLKTATLAELISNETPLRKKDVRLVLEHAFGHMAQTLRRGEDVQLQGIGKIRAIRKEDGRMLYRVNLQDPEKRAAEKNETGGLAEDDASA